MVEGKSSTCKLTKNWSPCLRIVVPNLQSFSWSCNLGKTSIEKKRFLSGIRESPKPPPDPISGNLVLFFGRQKRRFARMTEFFFNDDNDGFNDNYDNNFGNFNDNHDKND